MGIGATFGTDVNKLIFNATAIANIADNAASSPITNIYLSLHTADPGTTGASEATYTSYARVAVARTSGGFTCSGFTVVPVANVDFPACTGGTNTITYFGVWNASSTGKFLFGGTVSPNISVSTGVTPRLTTSTTLTVS
jgi:hypothetical protein